MFFFPGLGNNGAHEIGVGEKRLVDEIGLRTGARVTVMYPYGPGLTGNLSAFEKYKLIASLAYEKSSLPKYKAQEILGWLIVGLQLDGHVELCSDGFDDEQLNITFVGYSGGGQVAYSTAQALSGTLFVDNLVLFGAPYRAHDGLGNIGQLWDFVSVQDNVIFETGAIAAWSNWRKDNLYMYTYENATYCALAGDEATPYVHYDNGVNDYFGVDAKFNGQSCFGAHPEQSASSEFVAPLNLSRFEANMTMLVGIIEGRVK